MRKSITFITQFPNPINGLTKAVNTIYSFMNTTDYVTKKIKINNNKKFPIIISSILFDNSKIHYYSPASSLFGNLRDLTYISISLIRKKKVVLHFHNNSYRSLYENSKPIIKKWNKAILKRSSCCIVLGNGHKNMLKGLVNEEKLKVIHNGIDSNYILSNKEIKDKASRNSDCIKILYLSNFLKEKGYEEVVKIAKYFSENNKDEYKFIMCGKFFENEGERNFIKYINDNNIKNIDYRGAVYGNEKLKIIKESDIFILLSSYKNEVQPISILESMGCGNFIISTNVGVIPEMLTNKYCNIVKNIDEAILAIKGFKRDSYGIELNVKKVVNEYSLDQYNDNLYKIFEEQ